MNPACKSTFNFCCVALLYYITFGCTLPAPETVNTQDTATVAPPPTPEFAWHYFTDVDKMDGDSSYYAVSTSLNEINFSPPYDGGSTFKLTVRKQGKIDEVFLSVDKGQFLDNIAEDRFVRVKYDDEKPVNYSYTGTSDYRSDAIFLEPAPSIIAKIKKAKHIIIEAEFYQNGYNQIEFDVSNLVWQH